MHKSIAYFAIFFTSALLCDAKSNMTEVDSIVCANPRDKGDTLCDTPAAGLRFFYDKATKHCQPFTYAGCNGNENRFESLNECNERCFNISGKLVADDANSGHSLVIPITKCSGGVRAAFDSSSRILTCNECPAGYSCVKEVCCPSKEHTCNLEYDTGKYATTGSHTPRYFYSTTVKNCLLFTFYGALGNANNFETYNECIKFCKEK